MKLTISICFVVILLFSSCSSDDVAPTEPVQNNDPYFKLNVSGAQIDFDDSNSNFENRIFLRKKGEFYEMSVRYDGNDASSKLIVKFENDGDLIDAEVSVIDLTYGNFEYRNYKDFPSHYFDFKITSVDTVAKRLKGTFKGKLYLGSRYRVQNINGEALDYDAEFDLVYTESDPEPLIQYEGFEVKCSAKFNESPWMANHMIKASPCVFTASDEYKVEIFFNSNTNPTGTFNYTSSSTDNYVRISKFNIATLTYDYYEATGKVAYTYKEFHGANKYTYFGTFECTAVNPNAPNDIIQVSNGEFVSFQSY